MNDDLEVLESKPAKPGKPWFDWPLAVICWGVVIYHMAITQVAFLSSVENQIVHLSFVLLVLFLDLARNAEWGAKRFWWLGLMILGILGTVYVLYFYDHLEENFGFPENLDVLVGCVLITLVIIATWKSWGLTFPAITLASMAYFFWGHYLPQPFYHPEFKFGLAVSYLSVGFKGIFGPFLAFMANFGFLLVFFGALLEIMGANEFFLEVGKLGGRIAYGGPAHTAVIGSSFVGMASGSAIANVIITGSFTIPTMKRSGYKPSQAGAIEAAASTGSQIMPPIMGSAAFLMAAFLGKPYEQIIVAAIIPALLYYWGVGLSVELMARRDRISPPKEAVDYKVIWTRFLAFVVPLGFLTVLLIMNKSVGLASFWAVVLVSFFGIVQKATRPSFKRLTEGLVKGTIGALKISVVIAIVAIISQCFISTGLGNKVAYVVQEISGNNIYAMLFMTMVFSILLGCGMPTMAAYALMAILVAPSLVNAGLDIFRVHFFCFYFAIIAAITPPVAMATLAAASIAKSEYYKTGWLALMLALSGFIIPFMVVFNPTIVLEFKAEYNPWISILAAALGVTSLSMGCMGYFQTKIDILGRAACLLAAFFFFGYVILVAGLYFYLGLAIMILITIWQRHLRNKRGEVSIR